MRSENRSDEEALKGFFFCLRNYRGGEKTPLHNNRIFGTAVYHIMKHVTKIFDRGGVVPYNVSVLDS